MLEQLFELIELLKIVAPEALVKALVVLVSVFALRLLTVLPSSNWARAANVVFSVLLSGMLSGAVGEQEVYLLTLTSAVSAGLWEAFVHIYEYIKQRIPKKAKSSKK